MEQEFELKCLQEERVDQMTGADAVDLEEKKDAGVDDTGLNGKQYSYSLLTLILCV